MKVREGKTTRVNRKKKEERRRREKGKREEYVRQDEKRD